MAYDPYFTNIPIFREYKILKLPDMVKFQSLLILHDFLSGHLPQVVASKFQLQDHSRPRRIPVHFCQNAAGLDGEQIIPNYRLYNYRKFSLFYQAPLLWNTTIANRIPNLEDIPDSKTFFKKVLRLLFLDEY